MECRRKRKLNRRMAWCRTIRVRIGQRLAAVSQEEAAVPAPPKPYVPERWVWEHSGDAQRAHFLLFAVLATGSLAAVQDIPHVELPYFIALASTTIYIGAHKGLTAVTRQQISFQEGLLAPVGASVALFSVYLLIKYLPDLSFQAFFDAYFWLLGSFAIAGGAASLLRAVPFLAREVSDVKLPPWLLKDAEGNAVEDAKLCPADGVALVVGVALASLDVAGHHGNFTLNNLIACLIATDILQLLGIRSFKTAIALLVGLLAYDVFWVFGSPSVIGENVMLTVATSDMLSAPTRLLFPRVPGGLSEAATFPFSLLGLGDVAVPGLLACLALRYDASRAVDMQERGCAASDAMNAAMSRKIVEAPETTAGEMGVVGADAALEAYDALADRDDARRRATMSPAGGALEVPAAPLTSDAVLHQRRYFRPVMGAYVLGLLVAFGVNNLTGAGQPALLYLCPATLCAVFFTAARRREIGRLWQFVDHPSTSPLQKL